MKSIVLAISFLTMVSANCLAADNAELAIHGDARIVFATREIGQERLGTRDAFVEQMSVFDRQSRVGKGGDVTEAEYLKFAASHAEQWTDGEKKTVMQAFRSIQQKLSGFKLPLPKQILLIKTTGKEEGEAAYCRGNAIILPQKMAVWKPNRLERLLTHELFHILSSHNVELRKRVYKIVGFESVAPLALPKSIADLKITNPDAPRIDSVIKLEVAGKVVHAAPLLVATRPYDAERGGSFFAYLSFRLGLLEKDSATGAWQLIQDGGELQSLDPRKTPAYMQRIGGNTNYIIHPEEIMADNFVHLVQKSEDLKNPEIVAQLREQLKK